MRKSWLALLAVSFLSVGYAYPQSKEEFALKGITLIDMGEYQDGIHELRKARNLDPSDYELTLELGRAFLLWGKPRKAQDYLNLLLTHPDRNDELFILLSRSAPSAGKENPLNQGIVEFPESGALFAEMGRVLVANDMLDRAIAYWEKGIEVDPSYADNYLYAARIYMMNDEFFWGWLYGETYLNLKQHEQLDPSFVSDVKNAFRRSITLAAVAKPKDELGQLIHSASEKCASSDRPKELTALSQRVNCVMSEWNSLDSSPYAVPLFGLYDILIERQQLETYLFNIYGMVDSEELKTWLESNAENSEKFSEWMYWNGLELGESNRFIKLK